MRRLTESLQRKILLGDYDDVVYVTTVEELRAAERFTGKVILSLSYSLRKAKDDEVIKELSNRLLEMKFSYNTVCAQLLHNPHVSPEILKDLARYSDKALMHPNFPLQEEWPKLKDQLVFSALRKVLSNPNCPPKIFEEVPESKVVYLKERIALHPNCPAELAERIVSTFSQDYLPRVVFDHGIRVVPVRLRERNIELIRRLYDGISLSSLTAKTLATSKLHSVKRALYILGYMEKRSGRYTLNAKGEKLMSELLEGEKVVKLFPESLNKKALAELVVDKTFPLCVKVEILHP